MTDRHSKHPMLRFKGVRRILALGAALMLIVAACGGDSTDDTNGADTTVSADTTAAGDSGELQQVSMRFNIHAYAPHAPFVYAAQQGFYEEVGLEVTFGEGTGSDTTAALVAEGGDTFGTADFPGLAGMVALGAPVKAVGMLEQQSPLAISSLASTPIETPEDLIGKRIVMGAGDEAIFEAFLNVNGIELSEVETVTMSDAAQPAALAEGAVDGIAGWVTSQGIEIIETPGGIYNLLWADFGFPMLNLGLVANADMIEEDPDTVCRFVEASFRGWEAAEEDPEAAVNALIELYPNTDFDITLTGLQAQLELMRSPSTEGLPLGQINPDDAEESMQLLVDTGAAEEVIPVDDLISNVCFEG